MRTLILSYLILIIGISAYAQSTDRWTAFYNKKTELKGFKNAKVEIILNPMSLKFEGLISKCHKRYFKNITIWSNKVRIK